MNKLQVNQAILLGYSGYSGYKRQRYISPSVQNFKTTYTKYTKYTRSTPSTRLVSLNGAIKPVGQVAISLTAVFSATPLQFMQAKQCVF